MTIYDSDFRKLLDQHMKAQPLKVTCEGCGSKLEVKDVEVDDESDLTFEVVPCPYCLSEAREEGRNEESESREE